MRSKFRRAPWLCANSPGDGGGEFYPEEDAEKGQARTSSQAFHPLQNRTLSGQVDGCKSGDFCLNYRCILGSRVGEVIFEKCIDLAIKDLCRVRE